MSGLLECSFSNRKCGRHGMICSVLVMEMLQGVCKQHLRSRAVVGYGIKIFLPSPPNYVTRSPGVYEAFQPSLFTSLLLTLSQICGIHISDPSCCEISNFLTSSAELLLFGTASDALESLPISSVFSSG